MNNIHTTMNSGYHAHGSGGLPPSHAPRSGDRYPSPPNGATTNVNISGHASHQNHSSHSVGFQRPSLRDDQYQEERKKYLTAKYPQHQMRLIRKRLEVEDWLEKQLQELYNVVDDTDTYDCEIDLDDLLDLESTSEQRIFVLERLTNVPKSRDVVNRFVEELLEKVSTL